MTFWQTAIAECHQAAEGFVVVTLLQAKGSTPRDGGSKIVVTPTQTFDSIGGGGLEHLVITRARDLLAQGVPVQCVEHFPLAGKANQCCGGSVSALFEAFPESKRSVVVFGAGHVGKAVVQVLSECDARIDWVDARAEQFPEVIPGNVQRFIQEHPEVLIEDLRADAIVLILTHDHALDYRLLRTLLDETELSSIGMIGSQTKSDRFRARLRRDGIPEEADARWRCPVGLPEVGGKLPMEVAISIAAEVLSQSLPLDGGEMVGVSWKSVHAVLGKP